MFSITAICPECRAKIIFNNSVDWKTGYIRCPGCKNRVFVELKKNKKNDRK